MSKDIKENDVCEAECFAALSALAKFSELLASASDDENYNIIVAKILREAMLHGVKAALRGNTSKGDAESVLQIRTHLAFIAAEYAASQQDKNTERSDALH